MIWSTARHLWDWFDRRMIDEIDQAILTAADPRYGVVTRKTLSSVVSSHSAIDRRVRAGQLVTVFPGVYRLSSAPVSWASQLFAAVEWAGEGAMARGLSMAGLLELEGFSPGPLQIYTVTGKRHALVDSVRLRSARRQTMGLRWWSGIRTTTVERMLFDLCSLTTPAGSGRAMDECLIRRLTSIPSLRKAQQEVHRCGGAGDFSALLDARDDRDGRIRSEMERRMLALLRRISTHRVEADHVVEVEGRRYVIDFAVPDLRLGIECHSFRWHAGRGAFRKDSERQRRLTFADWTLLYYTWEDIVHEPERVLAEIESLLRSKLPL